MIGNLDIMYMENKIQMNIELVRMILIAVCTYYTNFKLLNKKVIIDWKLIIKSILIAILSGAVWYKVDNITSNIFIVFIISIMFGTKNIGNSILVTTISLAINYIVLILSIIINYIFNIFMGIENDYINFGIIVIIYMILICRILKIRKLKYGLKFLKHNNENEYINFLILNISVIILFATILLPNVDRQLAKSLTIALIIFSISMLVTVQKLLQLYYKQKLLVQDLNETKEELEKKTKEIEELESENINISKKSHTLAHKQKALEYKLQEIMLKSEISKEEVGELSDRIKDIGKDLYKEKTAIELDKTGILKIDDMLKYMQSECIKNKIDFELQLKGNIHYMTNNLISIEDLETLLADHIRNAIIAINHTNNVNRSILVRLGKIDEIYSLYIYDSGIEFKKETLESLGKKPSTTHADEGGTGMGFMNTFDTLRKCKASLTIEEHNEPSKDNYTKAIIIKFDEKNEYKIKSYRQHDVIKI